MGHIRKRKGEEKIPSLTLIQVLDIQVFYRQSIIVLPEKSFVDELQTKCLIILVVIAFGAEVFVIVAWHVLLEEPSQIFQAFFLKLLRTMMIDQSGKLPLPSLYSQKRM